MVTLAPDLVSNGRKEVALDLKKLNLEKAGFFDHCFKKIVINPILNYLIGSRIVNFFKRVSGNQILDNLEGGPGSWKSMLAHYNSKPRNVIDHLVNRFISFPASLRNRQKIVVNSLSQLIESYGKDEPISLVGVGSGSGNYTLEAIQAKRSKIRAFRAQLFDLNKEALDHGRELSKAMGLEKEVSFIQSEANQIEHQIDASPHIIETIGLIEYLSDEEVRRLFESIRKFRRPASSIVVSSIEERHGIDRFLKRTLKFNLNYRGPQRLLELLRRYGYRRFNIFPEPTGVFHVIVGHA